MVRKCRSEVRCGKCSGDHRVTVCRGKDENKDESKEEKHNAGKDSSAVEIQEKVSSAQLLTSTPSTHKATIMLQSASVWVKCDERRVNARVLFDTGSQRTFISKSLASQLRCVPICKEKNKYFYFWES